MITLPWLKRKVEQIDHDYPIPDDVLVIVSLLPAPPTIKGSKRLGYCRPKGVINGMRTFEIGIVHTLDTDEAVCVILHELRHVRQYIWGWLVDHPVESNGRTVAYLATWHGLACPHSNDWYTPWEIDARAFEQHAGDYFDE